MGSKQVVTLTDSYRPPVFQVGPTTEYNTTQMTTLFPRKTYARAMKAWIHFTRLLATCCSGTETCRNPHRLLLVTNGCPGTWSSANRVSFSLWACKTISIMMCCLLHDQSFSSKELVFVSIPAQSGWSLIRNAVQTKRWYTYTHAPWFLWPNPQHRIHGEKALTTSAVRQWGLSSGSRMKRRVFWTILALIGLTLAKLITFIHLVFDNVDYPHAHQFQQSWLPSFRIHIPNHWSVLMGLQRGNSWLLKASESGPGVSLAAVLVTTALQIDIVSSFFLSSLHLLPFDLPR